MLPIHEGAHMPSHPVTTSQLQKSNLCHHSERNERFLELKRKKMGGGLQNICINFSFYYIVLVGWQLITFAGGE